MAADSRKRRRRFALPAHSKVALGQEMSRKKLLPPGETLLHPITSAVEPIGLAELFPVEQPLELELGCGDGSFTLQYAQANPGR